MGGDEEEDSDNDEIPGLKEDEEETSSKIES